MSVVSVCPDCGEELYVAITVGAPVAPSYMHCGCDGKGFRPQMPKAPDDTGRYDDMAVHEYKCDFCGRTEEVKVTLGQASGAPSCPESEGLVMKRVYSLSGFTIK